MTDRNPSIDTFSKIEKLINTSRLNESFILIRRELSRYPNISYLNARITEEENTYKYLLDYISSGNDDPGRNEMLEKIKESLNFANDFILRESMLTDSSDIYSSTRRLFSLHNTKLSKLIENFSKALQEDNKTSDNDTSSLISLSQLKALEEIFNYVWTIDGNALNEYEDLRNLLDDPSYPEYFKSLLISALILGNTSYYNPLALNLLLDIYESTDSIHLKAKSLVGVILISFIYPHRITANISLKSRLIIAAEDEDFIKLSNEVLFNIVKTYDTKRIDDKMRNDVIPGLMKINPEIMDKMKNINIDRDIFTSDDFNPQWEELIENSEIGEKLRELNDMQLEGADVMATAFSNLKGFPFFSKVSNWFLPFLPGNQEFSHLLPVKDVEILSNLSGMMCASDIHSFILSLGNIPEERRIGMFNQMENQLKEAKNAVSSSIGETEFSKLTREIRQSLQDLYRFFKFYRKKADFKDPFALPLGDAQIRPLTKLFGIKSDNLKVMAEFYLKYKYYKEAAGLFEIIDAVENNVNVQEKIGYCQEKTGNFDQASEWYRKAEIIDTDNLWLEKRIAISLYNSGNTSEAVPYFIKVLEKDPENFHILMTLAQCLIDKADYDSALQHLYHAQYLKPEKLSIIRALAWTELLAGHHEKARVQYSKILQHEDKDKTDYLNAGHEALSEGDFKKALNLYRLFVELSENRDITSLVIAFRDDALTLKQLGIKISDLRLIVDKIRYDLMSAF